MSGELPSEPSWAASMKTVPTSPARRDSGMPGSRRQALRTQHRLQLLLPAISRSSTRRRPQPPQNGLFNGKTFGNGHYRHGGRRHTISAGQQHAGSIAMKVLAPLARPFISHFKQFLERFKSMFEP